MYTVSQCFGLFCVITPDARVICSHADFDWIRNVADLLNLSMAS